jgi:hypothetical protein
LVGRLFHDAQTFTEESESQMRRGGDYVCRLQSKRITEEKDIVAYFNVLSMHSPEIIAENPNRNNVIGIRTQ